MLHRRPKVFARTSRGIGQARPGTTSRCPVLAYLLCPAVRENSWPRDAFLDVVVVGHARNALADGAEEHVTCVTVVVGGARFKVQRLVGGKGQEVWSKSCSIVTFCAIGQRVLRGADLPILVDSAPIVATQCYGKVTNRSRGRENAPRCPGGALRRRAHAPPGSAARRAVPRVPPP